MKQVLLFIINHWEVIAVIITIGILIGFFVYLMLKLREHLMEKVVYHRTFSDIGAYEGEHLYLVETAYNPTPFPIFFINIEGYVYNGIPMEEFEIDPRRAMQYYVSRFHLLPFQQAKRRHLIKCAKRGYYHLETVDIYYNKKVRYINAPADCYVYPKIIPLHEIDQPNSTQQGDVVTKRWLIRDPFTLNGIREYRFGDPFNSVNFKATARSGTMDISAFKVNNRDFCSSRTFMVYLNFQIDTEVPIATKAYEQMMELGLSFASAIIRDAAYNGYKAGFAANCTLVTGEDQIRFPIKSGESHLEEILKEMAKVRHKTGISFFSMMENDVKGGLVDTEVYIITPFVNDALDEQISQMRRFGNSVNVLRLEDETRTRNEELEKEERKIRDAKRAREAAEIAERKRLNAEARAAGKKVTGARRTLKK